MSEASALDGKVELQAFLAHLKAGRKQEANEVLKQVLTSNPSKAGPYALLVGGMLAQNGQFREAVPIYQEAIRVNPTDPFNFLMSAENPRGEAARASAPIKAPRGCSRASQRFRYVVSRPDFFAVGIKSCSRNSLLPIRRGAKSAWAEMSPI